MKRHVVARKADITPGQRKLVHIGGRPIVVFNVKGEFFALLDRCPHQGGSLFHGDVIGLVESNEPGKYCYTRQGEMLKCAWHGWEFDIRTGQSWCDPNSVHVKTYPVEVEEGQTLLKGPFVAETFPVTVEDEYVLVEV